jgi:hypothetical protein
MTSDPCDLISEQAREAIRSHLKRHIRFSDDAEFNRFVLVLLRIVRAEV